MRLDNLWGQFLLVLHRNSLLSLLARLLLIGLILCLCLCCTSYSDSMSQASNITKASFYKVAVAMYAGVYTDRLAVMKLDQNNSFVYLGTSTT